jgi:hypothetical protein
LHQLYVALAGSFELHLDDGYRQETLFLNRPDVGPHVRSGVWRLINNFSGAALCVVLASEPYDEADYIRSSEEFRRYVAGNAASPAGPQGSMCRSSAWRGPMPSCVRSSTLPSRGSSTVIG